MLKNKKDIEAEMIGSGFWDDKENARKKSQRLDLIKKRLNVINQLEEKAKKSGGGARGKRKMRPGQAKTLSDLPQLNT
jgi:hypothetical protein